MVAEPGDGAFDDPPMTIPAQRPTVLGLIFRQAIASVGRNHFDAEFGQRVVKASQS